MLLSEWRILPLEGDIDLCYLLIGYRPTSLFFFSHSGASSTDSDSESLAFRSKPGAMPQ